MKIPFVLLFTLAVIVVCIKALPAGTAVEAGAELVADEDELAFVAAVLNDEPTQPAEKTDGGKGPPDGKGWKKKGGNRGKGKRCKNKNKDDSGTSNDSDSDSD